VILVPDATNDRAEFVVPLARAERCVGFAARDLRRKYADVAIGNTRQIGSTPYVSRC
jgi:hypothetical protein